MSKRNSYSFGAVYRANIIFVLLIFLIFFVRAPNFLVFKIIFGIIGTISIYNLVFSMLKKETLVIKDGNMTKTNSLFMKSEIILSNYSKFKIEDGIMKKIVATNTSTNFIETLLYNMYNVDLDEIKKVITEETN